MGKNVLITGGQGFVGRALVNRFADAGFAVTCADIHDTPLRDDVTCIKVDIRDADATVAACEGMDSVIHNASMVHTKHNREADIWAVNLSGAENVLTACQTQQVPQLIYISSASTVYEGEDIENGNESLPYCRISQAPYADSKIEAEKMILAADGSAGVHTCALRPHVIFGPGDNRFVPVVLEKAREGKLKRAIGDRDKLSDFTYIDNFVDAVVAAQDQLVDGAAACGQAYFVTNGEPMVWFDFVEQMLLQLGYPPITGKVPYWLVYFIASVKEGWDTLRGGTLNAEDGLTRFAVRYMVTHHYFDISKARRDLGWQPRISLAEGIQRTIQGLRKRDLLTTAEAAAAG